MQQNRTLQFKINHPLLLFLISAFFLFVSIKFIQAEGCPPETVMNPETLECKEGIFCDERGGWYPEGWFYLSGARINSCSALRCVLTGGVYYQKNEYNYDKEEFIKCDKNDCKFINEKMSDKPCVCPSGLKFSPCLGCVEQEKIDSISSFYNSDQNSCVADRISFENLENKFLCGQSKIGGISFKFASGFKDIKIESFIRSSESEQYQRNEVISLPKFTVKDITINILNNGVDIPLIDNKEFCLSEDYFISEEFPGSGSGYCRICKITDSKTCKIDCIETYTDTENPEITHAACEKCTSNTPHLFFAFWEKGARKSYEEKLQDLEVNNKTNIVDSKIKVADWKILMAAVISVIIITLVIFILIQLRKK